MKLFISFLLVSLLFLNGCLDPSTSTNELVQMVENNRIQVEFDKIEEAEWEGKKGFFIYVSITSLVDYHIKNDFIYQMGSTIEDENGKTHETIFSETVNIDSNKNSVLFRQFYSAPLDKSIDTLAIEVFVKPTYYKRNVVFKNLENNMKNVLANDLLLQDVTVEDKEIHLTIFDVHRLNGLTVSLLQEDENIFPAYTRTSYDQELNQLSASYEFTKAIPKSFTLTLNRLKLQDQLWYFPLTVPTN